MNKNAGTLDRGFRVLAGLSLIELAYSGLIGSWGWLGILPMLTGVIGLCPAYALLRLNTCRINK
ncbi:MAG TPA: DUF2892 domain-containing protein [Gallionella sp.]|nr:DUF2892 domain-containing protein [Gallionella sp.]OGS67458.1 MAG: hypothetical protein A2Z87_04620 [Gallionellales bacterium GWA2_54_124]OGT17758.1 MAG: hypothetical protein A2522_01605 [Gallionellales bacterium RIFOXYD12_FULL_53_10]HCI52284.1 DUF2892 domain-containing protein [Gallionella sp.]